MVNNKSNCSPNQNIVDPTMYVKFLQNKFVVCIRRKPRGTGQIEGVFKELTSSNFEFIAIYAELTMQLSCFGLLA